MKAVLEKIFHELDLRVDEENETRYETRYESGAARISVAEIKVLGQTSLLAQPEFTFDLDLAQTGDLDAQLKCDHFIKSELKKILPKYHLIYDDDSELIFIPAKSEFTQLSQYKNLVVKVIDPESALVSKAVKAPEKNKQLVRAALAGGKFLNLADRIVKEGGALEFFA